MSVYTIDFGRELDIDLHLDLELNSPPPGVDEWSRWNTCCRSLIDHCLNIEVTVRSYRTVRSYGATNPFHVSSNYLHDRQIQRHSRKSVLLLYFTFHYFGQMHWL